MNDQSGAAHYFLGQALANLGKFDEAEKELTKAISMGGKEMMEAHRILAIIYSSKGDKKRAATEIETYLNMNPSAADADQLRKALEKLRTP
jgi:Tfp pilus assembly protein PilF